MNKQQFAQARANSKLTWEPWPADEPGEDTTGTSPEAFRSMAVAARIAIAVMEKTKPDLVTMFQTTTFDDIERMMKHLAATAGHFRALANVLDGAYGRMLIAAETNYVRGGDFA